LSANNGLSCLIIGCGNIAGGYDADRSAPQRPPLTHAGAYLRNGGFVLTAGVEPDTKTREAFLHRWGIARGFGSMAELSGELETIDVVSICSPTPSHRADLAEALRLRPKVVFCEKPLASSVADAQTIVADCAAARTTLIVNYNRRWDPRVAEFREQLKSGEWGALRSVSGIYNRGVCNNGSHMVDLLHLLLGELTLRSTGKPVQDGLPGDPSIPLALDTASGVPVYISCGNAGDYSLFELQIVTERGILMMEDGGLFWRIRRARPSPVFRSYRSLGAGGRRVRGGLQEAMMRAVEEIANLARGPGAPSSSGPNALAALRICESALHLATGRQLPALQRQQTG